MDSTGSSFPAASTHAAEAEYETGKIAELVKTAVREGCSDLHMRAEARPRVRLDGDLFSLEGEPVSDDELRRFLYSMLTPAQIERFEGTRELDFSHALGGTARMRFNLFVQQGVLCAAVRLIPSHIPTMEEIYLPKAVFGFVEMSSGLVLVTGPTGSGKSTTLAAMINHVNANRRAHILTIEDPVEYVFEEKQCMISQREMGLDTDGYHAALRHAFRQDPDVVMIGEMRDLETMQAAITLAETGHLTFSTLHTTGASNTINRIIDSFSPHQQSQIRAQLAVSLQGIVSQLLVPLKTQRGRVAAREVLVCTRAIRNLLREAKVPQIFSAIQTGQDEGMMTMNYSLGELLQRDVITYDAAMACSPDRKDFAAKFGN